MDCIFSELKKVDDLSLIQYVAEAIHKQEFRSLYESFYKQEEWIDSKDDRDQESEEGCLLQGDNDTSTCRPTIRGQKEKEKEKENEKVNEKEKQQQVFNLTIEKNPDKVDFNQVDEKSADVQEIIEFWDQNGFGLSNMNGKQQLLSWLDDSNFLQPKAVILKAMEIVYLVI